MQPWFFRDALVHVCTRVEESGAIGHRSHGQPLQACQYQGVSQVGREAPYKN